MPEFVDRDDELARLRELCESDGPELAVVYGRRRIGKTALVLESIRDRDDAIYHQAVETTARDQIDDFVDDAEATYPSIARIRPEWGTLLAHLIEQDAIIVLDEFPFLADADESLPSVIQRLWDHEAEGTTATLVLTGSAIGMMYELTLSGSAPLYGRLSQQPSGQFEIKSLPFEAAMRFVPEYELEEQVFVYGIFGGTPHYLTPLDDSETLEENITRTLLASDGALHDEPETVLRMELSEVNRYFALLKAIAEGNHERNEIAQAAGIDTQDTSYYFDRLRTLHVIERDYPVTADPDRSRKTRFRLRDPLFRFWFRYIYGRSGRYELYGETAYQDLIEPELPAFVSDVFEELCHEAIPVLYPERTFTQLPGRWWGNEREIDLVAPTDDAVLLVGESKFTNQPVGYDVFASLETDAPHIDWTPPGGGEPEYEYALFARNGFNRSVKEAATERDDLRLFELEDVLSALTDPT